MCVHLARPSFLPCSLLMQLDVIFNRSLDDIGKILIVDSRKNGVIIDSADVPHFKVAVPGGDDFFFDVGVLLHCFPFLLSSE